MKTRNPLLWRVLPISLLAGGALVLGTSAVPGGDCDDDDELQLEFARIFFEYNSTDNDLGAHIFLDGEDWKKMKISTPDEEKKIFEVKGKGPYDEFGMTELFFEGAEPSLDDVDVEDLLDQFPEGEYEFEGKTVDGDEIEGEGELTHAIPNGPDVEIEFGANNFMKISWTAVPGVPPGFPDRPINIVAYQILVDEAFDVTLPGSATSVTVPPEFVAALEPGEHEFEVLAIEESGNQSITESSFVK